MERLAVPQRESHRSSTYRTLILQRDRWTASGAKASRARRSERAEDSPPIQPRLALARKTEKRGIRETQAG